MDSFNSLFYEQRGVLGPEEQEVLERVGAEISSRLHQAKQADEKGSSAATGYHGSDDHIQPRHRISITIPNTKRQSFTGMENDQAGRRGSRRLSSHPMGFVLSSTQPRSRASLVSSLVVRSSGSVAETHQL